MSSSRSSNVKSTALLDMHRSCVRCGEWLSKWQRSAWVVVVVVAHTMMSMRVCPSSVMSTPLSHHRHHQNRTRNWKQCWCKEHREWRSTGQCQEQASVSKPATEA